MKDGRIIGKYTGEEKGPLLVVFGGMHGNEQAGVEAISIISKMLEVEPLINPGFRFKGRLVGLRGNTRALKLGQRFIKRDLNRMWEPGVVEMLCEAEPELLEYESLEIHEIMHQIRKEIADYQPDKMYVLDLHTTTAFGGIFTIATDDPESVRIAVELHAPVVKGMLAGLTGTTLHYFKEENMGIPCVSVTFESGQHDEQLSINRAIAAITNCMRSVGCVREEDVENRHDKILIEYSKGLPKVAELVKCHKINEGDQFRMLPYFTNFQPVKKDQVLANDRHGEILSPADGLILMPLYQSQGDDGFFIIRELADF